MPTVYFPSAQKRNDTQWWYVYLCIYTNLCIKSLENIIKIFFNLYKKMIIKEMQ